MSGRSSQFEAVERRPRESSRGGLPLGDGGRTVSAILSNGRVVWIRLQPSLATLAGVNDLRESVGRSQSARARRTALHGRAIQKLALVVAASTRALSSSQSRGDRQLSRRLADAYQKVDKRISDELVSLVAAREASNKQQVIAVSRLGRRALWDQLVVVSALPLFAAYGRPGNPFHSNNLALAALLGVWLVGDKISDLLTGTKVPEPGIRGADGWSYVAPAANILIGWLLFRNQQQERLLTGFASEFRLRAEPGEDLVARKGISVYERNILIVLLVASDSQEDFLSLSRVPAVVSLESLTWAAGLTASADPRIVATTAEVDRGILRIVVTVQVQEPERQAAAGVDSVLSDLKVSWIVDTQEST